MASAPLISLRGISRAYPSGERLVSVLRDVDLDIRAGEMIAIVGASGSGKSTLMNILGGLDQPSTGTYRFAGRETAHLDADELAALRREHIGFIFQRYHLLPELTAQENVEMPAIYADRPAEARAERARALLERLGMGERRQYRPGQLSGGQQQRVSIARALMNDAEVILADEPTGALDSRSGAEVLNILSELHAEGRTVILVTHDMEIAKRAGRIIELRDGAIISDRTLGDAPLPRIGQAVRRGAEGGFGLGRFGELFRMALLTMRAHKLRTFLTMLGIIIGIASVISVVALGEGSRQKVLAEISSLGTNTLEIFPGESFGDVRSNKVRSLVIADADEIARQPYAAAVTPSVTASTRARRDNIEATVQANGVGAGYFEARGVKLVAGSLLEPADIADLAQVAVIDTGTRDALFPGRTSEEVLGEVILLDKVPARVIGVADTSGMMGPAGSLRAFLPYTTVQSRIVGSTTLRSITLKVADDTDVALAETAVTELLTRRHGVKDFFVINTDDIRQTITATTETLTLLIAAIALISLVVGGIGVMNIMLVSVSERVSEIGVRMAVGARQQDILRQFLVEAVVVCLLGGVLGVGLALGLGPLFAAAGSSFTLIYSTGPILGAVACASLIGITFGYMPARSASRLDPVAALSQG
ncbi:MAG: MacB family efflux pump subunit [Rhodobacteraceae bacterium]|nr:MacB family efflux pump subunit [Paracoccaceae bacterium]